MPLEAETHAVHSGMTMPTLAETACRRSGICTLTKVVNDAWCVQSSVKGFLFLNVCNQINSLFYKSLIKKESGSYVNPIPFKSLRQFCSHSRLNEIIYKSLSTVVSTVVGTVVSVVSTVVSVACSVTSISAGKRRGVTSSSYAVMVISPIQTLMLE